MKSNQDAWRILPGFETDVDGKSIEIEFADGERRWFDPHEELFLAQRVNLKPHRTVRSLSPAEKEEQEEMRKEWRANQLPKWGYMHGTYKDEYGEMWLDVSIPENDSTDQMFLLLNTKYWGYY